MAPIVMAGVFGLGAGIVGAVIYYAVIAITNFEIGLVAILIGYMVGQAVRKGARGRGGLRFSDPGRRADLPIRGARVCAARDQGDESQ
jgi:hypothetical protein